MSAYVNNISEVVVCGHRTAQCVVHWTRGGAFKHTYQNKDERDIPCPKRINGECC